MLGLPHESAFRVENRPSAEKFRYRQPVQRVMSVSCTNLCVTPSLAHPIRRPRSYISMTAQMPRRHTKLSLKGDKKRMFDLIELATSRRQFLRGTSAAAGLGALMTLTPASSYANDDDRDEGEATKADIQILVAAEIAEALAVTT